MQIPREVYHWHTVTLEYKACRWDEAYLSMLLFLHVPPFFYPTVSQFSNVRMFFFSSPLPSFRPYMSSKMVTKRWESFFDS